MSGGRRLRPKKIAAKLGIGLSTMWLWAKTDPAFPTLYKIGPNTTVGDEADIDAYATAKKAAAAKKAA